VAADSLDTPLRWLLDRARIIDCIVRFANAFDRQDWNALRACLADRIETDYSQFRGTPPGVESADDYVAARRNGLAGLRTLHLLSNHEVEISGDLARCLSAYRIYRATDVDGRERCFDSAGQYAHELARDGSAAWRITRIRQTVVRRSGDPSIHRAFRPAP